MYLALIVLPILGSIISGFFGRKVGVSGSQIITCTCVISTTFLAILAFIEVGLNNIPVRISLFRWIDAEHLNVSWAFNFDSLTVSMLIPVLIVSSLVHVYSIGYMSHDPHNQRFFSYLSLFTFMMIILVTGDNFLVMFVGWEGVGVCSYLLVSFWFTRIAANQSSLAAFLTNRVGDCVLTIGMFAILWSFGNVDYTTVFSLAPFYSENIIIFVGVCLLIGAMAKSSQVGLHIWLPMAMEGPTPVSALIHAATMVTAGVYLLMRASPLIEYSSTVLLLCLWVGAITTVFSSLVGLFQQDIKKVIAYSTMSQLGMMVIAIGLSSYNVALFHLVNHAFYKGLLFLGAGSVIHAVADNQDFRKYGGLISYLPLTYSVMLIASLSLVAFPFMTGFYSKDFILESAYGQYHLSGIIVYFVATIGAMFTTLYSVKVLYLTFLSNPNGPIVNYKSEHAAHEGDIFMSTPLIILAVFSIFFGYITKDIFIGMGSDFFSDNGLYIHPSHEIMLDTEFAVETFYKLLPLFFTITMTIISLLFTEFYPRNLIRFKFSNLGYNIFGFFNQRFLVEMYYNKYVSGQVLKLGGHTTKVLDKGAVEIFGPHGLERKLTSISADINSLSTGVVTSYALYILIGLIFYISITHLSETASDYVDLIIVLYALISVSQSDQPTKFNQEAKEKAIFNTNIMKIIFVEMCKLSSNPQFLFGVSSSIILYSTIFFYVHYGIFDSYWAIFLYRFIFLQFKTTIFMITFRDTISDEQTSYVLLCSFFPSISSCLGYSLFGVYDSPFVTNVKDASGGIYMADQPRRTLFRLGNGNEIITRNDGQREIWSFSDTVKAMENGTSNWNTTNRSGFTNLFRSLYGSPDGNYQPLPTDPPLEVNNRNSVLHTPHVCGSKLTINEKAVEFNNINYSLELFNNNRREYKMKLHNFLYSLVHPETSQVTASDIGVLKKLNAGHHLRGDSIGLDNRPLEEGQGLALGCNIFSRTGVKNNIARKKLIVLTMDELWKIRKDERKISVSSLLN